MIKKVFITDVVCPFCNENDIIFTNDQEKRILGWACANKFCRKFFKKAKRIPNTPAFVTPDHLKYKIQNRVQ